MSFILQKYSTVKGSSYTDVQTPG